MQSAQGAPEMQGDREGSGHARGIPTIFLFTYHLSGFEGSRSYWLCDFWLDISLSEPWLYHP